MKNEGKGKRKRHIKASQGDGTFRFYVSGYIKPIRGKEKTSMQLNIGGEVLELAGFQRDDEVVVEIAGDKQLIVYIAS